MPANSCSAPIGSSNGATWFPNDETSWSSVRLEVRPFPVELVHEDRARKSRLDRELPRGLGLDLDAVDRRHHDDHGIDGADR